MKKITIVLAVIATMLANANARTYVYKDSYFGIKGGLNIPSICKDQIPNQTLQLGFNAGITYERRINNLFRFAVEAMYSMEGYAHKNVIGKTGTRTNVSTNFVNIPVLLKIYPIGRLYIEVGPQGGIFLGGKNKITSIVDGKDQNSLTGDLNTNSYNAFVLALAMGLGFELNPHFYVNARYNLGLTPWIDVKNGAKAHAFQIGLGFKF